MSEAGDGQAQVRFFLRLSVAAACATIALKAAAYAVTGSVGLLSDALESLVNLAAALFASWIVRVADTPPDDEHPFGHGKAEYFSAGAEGLLILVAAGGIAWAAVERFGQPRPLTSVGLGGALSLLASAINGVLAWRMAIAARRWRSIVLAADSQHLMTDVWTSVGVLAGVALVPLTGWLWLDPALAFAVALHIVHQGLALLRRSVDGLMDRAMSDDEQRRVREVLQRVVDERYPQATLVRLRTRIVGRRRHAELRCLVPADWTVLQAARLRGELQAGLHQAFDDIEVLVDVHPAAGSAR